MSLFLYTYFKNLLCNEFIPWTTRLRWHGSAQLIGTAVSWAGYWSVCVRHWLVSSIVSTWQCNARSIEQALHCLHDLQRDNCCMAPLMHLLLARRQFVSKNRRTPCSIWFLFSLVLSLIVSFICCLCLVFTNYGAIYYINFSFNFPSSYAYYLCYVVDAIDWYHVTQAPVDSDVTDAGRLPCLRQVGSYARRTV